MLIKVPDYFLSFRCIADKCNDSCCIGWEIDIDEDSKLKYELLDTPLGQEIREKTSHGYFPLGKNGRCAFLDERGLCRIISGLGEGYLCDICNEHPRYYGVSENGYEAGLGLGCEEAARIILSLKKIPKLVQIERDIPYRDEDEFAKISDRIRNDLFDDIFKLHTTELMGKYIAYASFADEVSFEASTSRKNVAIPKLQYTPAETDDLRKLYIAFLDTLAGCEPLTNDWTKLTEKLGGVNIDNILRREDVLRPLLYYFTHRYVREGVDDMSLGARVLFALCSSLCITELTEVVNSDDRGVKSSVLYSKNIEYSTDNVSMILDGLCEFL